MRPVWFYMGLSAAALGALMLLSLSGCGGEGGPLRPSTGATGPSAEFLALLPEAQRSATYVGAERCGQAGCHPTKFTRWKETHHAQVGADCERCHGPGSKHAAAPSKENILTLPKAASPAVCGQCHGTIYAEWSVSKHSQIEMAPIELSIQQPARYGRQFRCMGCHSGLFRVAILEEGVDVDAMTDEQMAQVAEETLQVVPHSATCVTCHSPHKRTGNLTDDGKEAQLRHPVFNLDTAPIDPGSPVTEYLTYNHICAQCHNGRGANPSDAALQAGTSRPNMHDSNQFNMLMGIGGVEGSGPVQRNTAHATTPGQCSHCHMPDSRHTFTVSFDKGCAPCHTAADAAARTATVKAEIQQALYALRTRLEAWSQATFGDPDLWDYTALIAELGKTPPNQAQVPIEVKRARHNYYFVIRDSCFGPHNAPYIRHLINIANQNLDAIGVPRGRAVQRGQVSLDYIRSVLESDLRRAEAVQRRD